MDITINILADASLRDELRETLLEAYPGIGRSNMLLQALINARRAAQLPGLKSHVTRVTAVVETVGKIENAQQALLRLLQHAAPAG